MTTAIRRSPVLVVGVIIGLVMGAAEQIGSGIAWRAALSTVIPIGYAALVTVLAPRNEAASALAGRPVDERWEHINLEAATWAFGATAIVVLAMFVGVDAQGGDWHPYAFMAAVMAVAYVGSLLLVRLRH